MEEKSRFVAAWGSGGSVLRVEQSSSSCSSSSDVTADFERRAAFKPAADSRSEHRVASQLTTSTSDPTGPWWR